MPIEVEERLDELEELESGMSLIVILSFYILSYCDKFVNSMFYVFLFSVTTKDHQVSEGTSTASIIR